MTRVCDEDLSALLDGELSAATAADIRARIAGDPALHREFDMLAGLDRRLRRAADEAAFLPAIAFPAETARTKTARHLPAALAVVLALITIRLLPKLAELPLGGIGIHLAACAAISFAVVTMAREPATRAP